MIALFATSLFAAPRNGNNPSINLNCEFTNPKSNENFSFAVNPPGSLFRDYTITKNDYNFTFKMRGWILYSLRTRITGPNIKVEQKDNVDWSFKHGYHLKHKKIDINNDQIKFHCDEVINNNW